MTETTRYQVFISSTYEDLREERQQATQAILEAGHFPSGMELFPASDSNQWELIKRVIKDSDYYIVIIGGRYGNVALDGRNYTEMEYDYAVSIGVPVLGFVRTNVEEIPSGKSERTEEGRKKLNVFREKVLSRTCRKYSTPLELGMSVLKSLVSEIRINPRTGWVRADRARSDDDLKRENLLQSSLAEAQNEVRRLERELRDRCVSVDLVPRETLARGDDLFHFMVTFKDNKSSVVVEAVGVSWDEIFLAIGPALYGFIVGKVDRWNKSAFYPFEDNIHDVIRRKIIDRVQGRSMKLDAGQIDRCIFHLKELGLLMFDQKDAQNGEVWRGVTLTEYGERYLTMKNVITRS